MEKTKQNVILEKTERDFLTKNYGKWFDGELSVKQNVKFERLAQNLIGKETYAELEIASQNSARPLLAEYLELVLFNKQPHYLDLETMSVKKTEKKNPEKVTLYAYGKRNPEFYPNSEKRMSAREIRESVFPSPTAAMKDGILHLMVFASDMKLAAQIHLSEKKLPGFTKKITLSFPKKKFAELKDGPVNVIKTPNMVTVL